MSLVHAFVSAKADSGDTTRVQPSNWNAAHVFTGGSDGQLLVRDSAQSDGATWTGSPTLTSLTVNSTTTVKLAPGSAAVHGLQVIRTQPSSFYTGLERAIFVPAIDGNENYGFTVNSIGTVYTGAAIVISGTIDANGFPEEASNVAGLTPYEPAMLSIVPDIVGPAINVYPAQAGSWFFSALERTTGNHIFNIEANGSLTWGAGARGAEDTTLARTAAGKLSLTGPTPMLQLGGTTASFPALKRSSAAIAVRLADDSANAALVALSLTASSLTSGRVPFASAGGLLLDDANLYWDATNHRLALGGFTNPQALLHVFNGTLIVDNNDAFFGDHAAQTTGAYLNVGHIGTADGWIDARGSGADVGLKLRVKGAGTFVVKSASADLVTVLSTGLVGIGVSPAAVLHLAAGTATANTAPLKLTSGTNLTTAEAGAMEYNGTNLFFTRAGTVRENVLVAIDNVSAPATAAGTPTTRYGADTKYLGDPARWLSVNVLGTTYKLPLYT